LKKIFIIIFSLFCTFGINAKGAKQWRDSLEVLNKALDLNPSSTDLRLKKAAVEIELEQYEYAIEEYSVILKKDPHNLAALFYRAFSNEKLNRYRFARSDYEDFLRIAPVNFEARLGLALVNQKDKHFTEAFDQINMLVEQYPDSAIAYAARAGIERERGAVDAAIFDWTEAIKRDSKNVDYYISRSDLFLVVGKRDDARRDLDFAIKLGANRSALRNMLQRCK
jgi:tetratricopeptide (TPR) repeat protein